MTDSEVDELRLLRHRAYGPAADIHADPKALQRLRQLEDDTSSSPSFDETTPDAEPIEAEPVSPNDTEPSSSDIDQPSSPPAERRRIKVRLRRSTVLILLAVAVFMIAVSVALTLVQRVQTDPLQVGASQVERLSPDLDFDTPTVLNRSLSAELVAYQDFHGLRAVVQEPTDTDAYDECLTIYEPDRLEVSNGGYSYSGQLMLNVCAAGAFPAAVAFTVLTDSPDTLRDAYPEGTSLQFVYDRSTEEVVVFQGQ